MKVRLASQERTTDGVIATMAAPQSNVLFGQGHGRQASELARTDSEPLPERQAETATVPALPYSDAQMFALVDATRPTVVSYYGVEVGGSAFTFGRDSGDRTVFGQWNSMQSAYERLDMIAGPHLDLALILFDSVPVMALTPLLPGVPGLGAALATQITATATSAIGHGDDERDA